MRKLTLAGALGAALLAAPALAAAAAATVGPGYVTGGGEWNTGGGITAVVRVLNQGGTAAVCGAWATDGQSALSATLNEDVMQAGSVYLGGTRLVDNLGFMHRVAWADSLTGDQANCVSTGTPWRPGFDALTPRLRFPRQVFHDSAAHGVYEKGGINLIVFRETPRPDAVR